jgi:rSAM/selenodomain-associated transferase 2
MSLSIIVPCLNEAEQITATLGALASLRERGVEVIVVDGRSSDDTITRARPHADCVVAVSPGRAVQMNAGAARARGDVFLFLHADSRLPAHADELIEKGLAASGRGWGRFDVRISGRHALLAVISTAMNWRSRATGIATGDQAIFVTRCWFERAGRFPEIRLMEDVALSRALKKLGRPLCIAQRVITSGRRWQKHGVVRTMALMWKLRLAYWLGANPDDLAVHYAPHERS